MIWIEIGKGYESSRGYTYRNEILGGILTTYGFVQQIFLSSSGNGWRKKKKHEKWKWIKELTWHDAFAAYCRIEQTPGPSGGTQSCDATTSDGSVWRNANISCYTNKSSVLRITQCCKCIAAKCPKILCILAAFGLRLLNAAKIQRILYILRHCICSTEVFLVRNTRRGYRGATLFSLRFWVSLRSHLMQSKKTCTPGRHGYERDTVHAPFTAISKKFKNNCENG